MDGYNTTHQADDDNTEGVYIPKAYQFERDMDRDDVSQRQDTLEFPKEANQIYAYESIEALLDNLKDLKDMIVDFKTYQVPRLEKLEQYSLGNNFTISTGRRRIEQNKSDYRIKHNIGGFISEYINGFILSEPITVSYDAKSNDIEPVNEIRKLNDLDALNLDLGFDSSRYGKAYEYHYRDEDNVDRIVLIDAKEVFFIHSADVTKKVIGAVHCPTYNDETYISLYTDTHVIKFKRCKYDNIRLERDDEHTKDHVYGIVPFVEWKNNRFNLGDFETGIPLIDAYDAAQSDTANYMSDLNDALLFLSGDLSALDKGAIPAMMDANVIVAETGTSADGKQTSIDGKYLYKQYDVVGTEAYKDRLLKDLFKFTNVPNMDDANFAGQQSGIALEYKLIGLKQIQKSKETQFSKALRRRYQLIENAHKALSGDPISAIDLSFTFHPNLPADVWQEVKTFIESGGEISQETLRELATFTDNDKELERLINESLDPSITDEERNFLTRGVANVDTDETE